MENILPLYNDFPTSVTRSFVEEKVIDYKAKNEMKCVALRNLFPPVQECCSSKLDYRANSKCIVFEKNDGAVPGQLFSGLCKKCNRVFLLNSVKFKDADYYYKDVLEQKYFMNSRETVFETRMLYHVDRDM